MIAFMDFAKKIVHFLLSLISAYIRKVYGRKKTIAVFIDMTRILTVINHEILYAVVS